MEGSYIKNEHSLERLEGLTTSNESVGNFKDKKVGKGNKTLCVALMIIGLITIGVVGGTGFANLGHHLNWWPAAGFSHLSQIGAIAMVASGGGSGLLLIIGGSLIGLAKTHSSKGGPSNPKPIITSAPKPITTENDILIPSTPDLTINVDDLKTSLRDSTFTFVLQTNNDYTLVEKIPDSGDELKLSGNISPYELGTQAIYSFCQGLTFVLTSPLPPEVTREIEELLQPVINPGFEYKNFTSSDSDQ